MQRLHELDRLHIHAADLLSFGCQTLPRNKLFCIDNFSLSMLVLSSEGDLELRMSIIAKFHQI